MIALSRPSIRRKDMDAVLSCMVSDRLGPGTIGDDLVTAVSTYLGVPGGIALRERSRALGIALSQLELEPESVILLDPLVPRSYHELIISMGLEPRYVDTISGGATIDPAAVEREAGDAAAVITSTHLGFVPDMDRVAATGLAVIEDISQGMGSHTGEQRAGRYGRFALLAMEPESIITAGGGTLVLSRIKKERAALRRLATELQSDALLPDMNAALGTTQIKEIERYIARRAEIASIYSRALMRGKHRAINQPGDAESVWFSFPVVVAGSSAEVQSYARSKGVETARPFADSVLSRYGVGAEAELSSAVMEDDEAADAGDVKVGHAPNIKTVPIGEFPNATELLLRCVVFPLYPSLSGKEVEAVERVILSLP